MIGTRRHRLALACAAIALSLSLSGCEWTGLNSLPLPGTEGTGDGSYQVKIQMPNVTTLSQNSPVRVNDVTVGTVTGIEVQSWHALVTVSLNKGVQLPANATAKIGQTSLLGSNHVELAPPVDEKPVGTLEPGATIPIERAGAYPTTEQTLSSLSVVLNGGGLAQLQDITTELNKALDGRTSSVRDLIPQLNSLVTSLDQQRNDIVSALSGLDRLSGQFSDQRNVITDALDKIPPALTVLTGQRQNLTNALVSLGNLSDVASRVIDTSGDDLKANIKSLGPVLKELADSGNHLTDVLTIALTFPFPMKNLDHALKGDYANLMMSLDLTGPRLDSDLLTGTPLGGTLGGVEGILGSGAGVAGQAGNPVTGPLQTPAAAPPMAVPQPQIPGFPNIPGLPNIPGITTPLPGGGGR
ncbi:MCE family protein [Antrihabitans cavernicola]|uniref:MCE family protein n=1 Tax=Antrihabitans cavernicola TaxID=2495913 RepID=A0A5A7SBS8_9NOCA|nr:MCE family protein [Spelaeibacter cavernicola]KAA0021935.1 MCE family protein [Spelaeibacter cavernicola]